MGGLSGAPQKADPMNPRGRVAKWDTVLPPEGYQGPIPAWPLDDPSLAEIARWNWLWRKPQAVVWITLGNEDVVARYVRNCIILELNGASTVASAYLVSEIRQQEDRLGRSPLALQRMRWSVGEQELAEVKANRGGGMGTVTRLRAIDPAAASG